MHLLMQNFKYALQVVVMVISLCHMTWSAPHLYEEDEVSKEFKDCMLECLTCVEFWGRIYNGEACAQSCLLTDGASKDDNCQLGTNVGKRYAVLKAKDICRKQCEECAESTGGYDERKCIAVCDKTSGNDQDKTCSKHRNMYDVISMNNH